jgi:hypothetical protein
MKLGLNHVGVATPPSRDPNATLPPIKPLIPGPSRTQP